MRLSIVILTCNQRDITFRCLNALRYQYNRGDVEIIVVDNGSDDGTVEAVEAGFPDVRLIANQENRGVSFGRNQGLRMAQGDKILILDNDTVPDDEAINTMCRWLDDNASTGIVACRLTDPQGNTQDSFKPYPGLIVKISNLLHRGKKRHVELPSEPVYPDYVIGACQMFRRSLLFEIGMLDEHIFYGPEDADFCLRARNAGYSITYLPHISMVHDWRRATTRRILSRLGRRHISALFYLYRKHRRLF
ncbi:MAG: glycosyltransferase family 2 protein [Muribaculaceae bacterium]|nr:glycosyltransferase family 2 protein [Muribaculaceae bacterium]